MSNIGKAVELFIKMKGHAEEELNEAIGKAEADAGSEGLSQTQRDQIEAIGMQKEMAMENMMFQTVSAITQSENQTTKAIADKIGQ